METNAVIRTLMSHRSLLLAYARSIVGDIHVAEDLFQEVSVLAIEKAGEIKDPNHLLGWARQATRFKALHALRGRKSTPAVLDVGLLDSLDAHWDQAAARSESDTYGALELCLQELTPRAQKLLKLRYADGVRGGELAAQVGRKLSTTYAMLAQVHGFLAECIKRRLADGGLSHA